MKYYCGLDFGTSNSVLSLVQTDSDGTRSSARSSARIVAREPSVLFFPKQGICETIYFVGEEAIAAYLEYHMQGRFIQSLKSLLADPLFTGTVINKRPYTPADLVRFILGHLKRKAEKMVGQKITAVVVGRPVYFSSDPDLDAEAELSLKNAARMAGFRQIEFQYEPVAAAMAYETHLTKAQTVLVADLGGGTTDFTIMRLGPQSDRDLRPEDDVLATVGIGVGGDGFDSAIMWDKLVKHFGYGSSYESWGKQLEVPIHIYRTLCHWEQMALLKTHEYREEIRYFLQGSNARDAIERLMALIDNNLGYALFKSIEAAKIALTEWDAATIEFDQKDISLNERITEPELAGVIFPDLKKISRTIDEVLERAGLTEDAIGTVFLTGGSSLLRRIQKLFGMRFGSEKVRSGMDTFTSVAAGLALHSHRSYCVAGS